MEGIDMKWTSVISNKTELESAAHDCIEQIQAQMIKDQVDLIVVFLSPDYELPYEGLIRSLKDSFPISNILGCTAGGMIGGGKEIEQTYALSITAASLPDVSIETFSLQSAMVPDLDDGPNKWHASIGISNLQNPQFVILADPFSFPTQNFLSGMDFAYPNSTKIGGLASGTGTARTNSLFLNNEILDSGLIGIALSGNIRVDTVVAQGCKPIGDVMRITSSESNILKSIDNRNPMEILGHLHDSLDKGNQNLMRHSLFVGVVMDSFNDDPQHGDFLIRNIMGIDNSTGYLGVGETLNEGQLIQFHLRDAKTSAEDLDNLLRKYRGSTTVMDGTGALLFSCLGRGKYLYGVENFDTGVFNQYLEGIPLGGFFCNGEIGPVSGTTHIHGYTSSFGIFAEKDV